MIINLLIIAAYHFLMFGRLRSLSFRRSHPPRAPTTKTSTSTWYPCSLRSSAKSWYFSIFLDLASSKATLRFSKGTVTSMIMIFLLTSSRITMSGLSDVKSPVTPSTVLLALCQLWPTCLRYYCAIVALRKSTHRSDRAHEARFLEAHRICGIVCHRAHPNA